MFFIKSKFGAGIAGFSAGALNGLFGAGGGMVLAPLMSKLTDAEDRQLFPLSIAVLIPICGVSILFSEGWDNFSILQALPYLAGSAVGGVCAGILSRKIPVLWLHRVLGVLIIWGGIRYLC